MVWSLVKPWIISCIADIVEKPGHWDASWFLGFSSALGTIYVRQGNFSHVFHHIFARNFCQPLESYVVWAVCICFYPACENKTDTNLKWSSGEKPQVQQAVLSIPTVLKSLTGLKKRSLKLINSLINWTRTPPLDSYWWWVLLHVDRWKYGAHLSLLFQMKLKDFCMRRYVFFPILLLAFSLCQLGFSFLSFCYKILDTLFSCFPLWFSKLDEVEACLKCNYNKINICSLISM